MAKQVQVWETEDGDVFDSYEEAVEHEAKQALCDHVLMDDNDFDMLHRIMDDKEFAKLYSAYISARSKANAFREAKNDRPAEIKKVLGE